MKRLAASTGELPADPGFAKAVIDWQRVHGRHSLPWQNTRDPYRIWLSEIMLQQTQVSAVIPYYARFLARFPDVLALADAAQAEVMELWSGLGYYSRARNLHRCAQVLSDEYGGVFPASADILASLPGIGRSTAAAIAAFAFGERAAILDGNVKRVFCRVFGIEGFPGQKQVEDGLWQRARSLLPAEGMESYTQGLMDLGATVCTRSRPRCAACPLAARCEALATDRVAELPERKARKAVPEKEAHMLVLLRGQSVLLERRGPSGIWGGLLSLPEVAPDDGLVQALVESRARRYGSVHSLQPLTRVTHGFTHFTLHFTPWLVQLDDECGVADGEHEWLPLSQVAGAALPAPVKKLLLQLAAPDLLSSIARRSDAAAGIDG